MAYWWHIPEPSCGLWPRFRGALKCDSRVLSGLASKEKGIDGVTMVFRIWRWFVLSFHHSNLLNAQLMHGAQASSADADTHLLAINDHGFLLGVELPLPIGSPFRMANIVTKLGRLTTYIALS